MLRCIFLILLLFSSVAIGATGDVRPFVPGSLAKILAAREGKPFILVFWSLDCQYCPTELRMLSRIMDRHHKLDTVLVATDTLNDASQLASLVESYGMSQAEQWVFADSVPERLRSEIDRYWYGEIPRTHFYDQTHQRKIKTGLIEQKFIEEWLTHNVKFNSENH
ncbi:MAG: redoxin domain-containing protein [Nitrosospira sp.]|nr:redoxin domain-containing protein [Nitrosospira sp.]